MKVDFSEEFRDIDQLEFETVTERHDYIHQKVLDGLDTVIDLAMVWLNEHVKESRWDSHAAECRFYESALIERFSRRFMRSAYLTFMQERIKRVTEDKASDSCGHTSGEQER